MRKILGFVAVMLLGLGLTVTYFAIGEAKTALANPQPTRVKFSQWLSEPGDAEWLELEDVHVDWADCRRVDVIFKERRGESKHEHYFVVGRISQDDTGPVRCYFLIHDAEQRKFMMRCREAVAANDTAWLEQNQARRHFRGTISGRVRNWVTEKQDVLKELSKTDNLSTTVYFVDKDKAVHPYAGYVLSGVGLLMVLGGGGLGLLLLRMRRRR